MIEGFKIFNKDIILRCLSVTIQAVSIFVSEQEGELAIYPRK